MRDKTQGQSPRFFMILDWGNPTKGFGIPANTSGFVD
jgi:hypothetical protein